MMNDEDGRSLNRLPEQVVVANESEDGHIGPPLDKFSSGGGHFAS